MYIEYKLKCALMNETILPEWKFRDIFNTEFNLSFHRPKIDTCRKCDSFNAEIAADTPAELHIQIKTMKENHLHIVEKTKNDRKDRISQARTFLENKEEVLVFDLQRALEIPSISTSEAYYKRQMWCYNLCIYDEVREKAYMYVWDESVGSRGSQEIGSCLYKHFLKYISHDTKRIILYSDSCGGQNRNIKITMMLKHFLANVWKHKCLEAIEQIFYVSGHSYNSCDRSFALIEKQRKMTENVLVPQHWFNIISQAKKKKPKFVVVNMTRNDFYSAEELVALISNRKKSVDGKALSWLGFQHMVYKRSEPFVLRIKEFSANDSPFQLISLHKKKTPNKFPRLKLKRLYKSQRAINKSKYDDLIGLLKYVPKVHHAFYKSLKYSADK